MQNTPAALANIAAPADAHHVEGWIDETGDGTTWGRFVRSTRRLAAGVEVTLVGWQDATGDVERHASVWATDVELDPAALRKLAAIALAAADELDETIQAAAISDCGCCDDRGLIRTGTHPDGSAVYRASRCQHQR